MRDDFLSSDWAAHHDSLTDAVTEIVHTIGRSLERLNAYEFDAPWRHDAQEPAVAKRD